MLLRNVMRNVISVFHTDYTIKITTFFCKEIIFENCIQVAQNIWRKIGEGEKLRFFKKKKAKAKNMTRDYFVQKSTKIGDMRRRENAKN